MYMSKMLSLYHIMQYSVCSNNILYFIYYLLGEDIISVSLSLFRLEQLVGIIGSVFTIP